MTLLVTGGAGFIGSNFILDWFRDCNDPIVNIDKLTYAGNTNNLSSLDRSSKHVFVEVDICDGPAISEVLLEHQPSTIRLRRYTAPWMPRIRRFPKQMHTHRTVLTWHHKPRPLIL